MEFSFTDDQEALRASVREVLEARASARTAMGSKTGTDDALWRQVCELGWPGVAVDEQLGGLGLGLIESCILAEEVGRTVAPIPVFSTLGLAAPAVSAAPEGPARDAFLRSLAAGEIRATLALGQRDGRYDAAGVSVKAAASDGGGWRFSGKASLVPEAHLADRIVVLARTASARDKREGLTLFLVDAAALKRRPKAVDSLDGTRRLADVSFAGVEVGDDARLTPVGEAWPVVARALDRSAVLLAAEAVGVAERALEMAAAYAKEREQFGKKIGSFQAISHRLADMMLAVENARSHAYYAAWALEEGTPDAHLAAASAKAAASDAARIATGGAIQVHGGIGFTWEHDLHLYYRRAKFCELYLGDASRWRERVASLLAS